MGRVLERLVVVFTSGGGVSLSTSLVVVAEVASFAGMSRICCGGCCCEDGPVEVTRWKRRNQPPLDALLVVG